MRSRMIAFCCGIAAVSRFSDLPTIHAIWLVLLAVPSGVTLWRAPAPFALAAALLLGLGWAIGIGNARVAALLPGDLEGVDFWVMGEVRGLPQNDARSQQFTFQVEKSCFTLLPDDCHRQSPERAARFNDRKILLNHYGDADMIPDQRWLLRVRLNQPHGFANPGGFDYEGWLFQQGFTAKGYVRENPFNARLDGSSLLQELPSISHMRYHLRAKLLDAMQELPHASIILALVLGDQEQISAESWSLFTATGTNHLVVISGMHVAFIALLCYGLSNRLARLSPWLLLRVPAQKCGAVSAVIGAFLYCLLAGFSVPTQRSCIMVLVFMSGQIIGRQFPPSFSFCLALTLVLLINPLSLTGAGFWLSFGAVGTLLLAFGGIRRLRGASRRRAKKADEIGSLDDDERPRWSGRRLWQQHVQPQYVVFIGMIVPLGTLAPGATQTLDSRLFAGPQEENKLSQLAPGLELVKDYGWLTILSKPLYWLLDQLHSLLGNWGWAIVALVVLLKIAFYWLNASAYKSMAKMKAINPKVMELRERYKDKPQQMQQEMMRIYREEKVNPLGGCLPIFVQMPFFIALYWVLLSSVEMRGAPWLGWITDLSTPDPFFTKVELPPEV